MMTPTAGTPYLLSTSATWPTTAGAHVLQWPMAMTIRPLAAFHADLAAHADRLTVVALSEFGRRVQENGSLGTDHGHGSVMLLMGGHVVGGQVHGRWPGLAPPHFQTEFAGLPWHFERERGPRPSPTRFGSSPLSNGT